MSARVVGPRVAEERLGKRSGGGEAADLGRADEQVSMRNVAAPERAAKESQGGLVTDEIPKRQILTIRSTSSTKTIAPPTCTFTG